MEYTLIVIWVAKIAACGGIFVAKESFITNARENPSELWVLFGCHKYLITIQIVFLSETLPDLSLQNPLTFSC